MPKADPMPLMTRRYSRAKTATRCGVYLGVCFFEGNQPGAHGCDVMLPAKRHRFGVCLVSVSEGDQMEWREGIDLMEILYLL